MIFKCLNCGGCCGPVPVSNEEEKKIKKFITKNKLKIKKAKKFSIDCKFRVDNKCQIYEVRPEICRNFGTCSGKFLKCPNNKEGFGKAVLKYPVKKKLLNSIK